jgi:hypothetical protein
MQTWQVTAWVYHLKLLCMLLLLLNRNPNLWILLVVASINHGVLDCNLDILRWSLLQDLSLELCSVVLSSRLSIVDWLVRWGKTLVILAYTQLFRSEIMLTDSWLIEQEVLVWYRWRSQNLISLVLLGWVDCGLVIYRLIHPGIYALIYSTMSMVGYEFWRFLNAVVHVVSGYLWAVVCLLKLSWRR